MGRRVLSTKLTLRPTWLRAGLAGMRDSMALRDPHHGVALARTRACGSFCAEISSAPIRRGALMHMTRTRWLVAAVGFVALWACNDRKIQTPVPAPTGTSHNFFE